MSKPDVAGLPQEEWKAVDDLIGKLYQSITPTSELGSKATFPLLASIVLIGLSLASTKPDSVQVLGFTIQADHWLFLAIPLAVVIAFSIFQLGLSWAIELKRYGHFVKPQLDSSLVTVHQLLKQLTQRYGEIRKETLDFAERADRYGKKVVAHSNDVEDWFAAELKLLESRARESSNRHEARRASGAITQEAWFEATTMDNGEEAKARAALDTERRKRSQVADPEDRTEELKALQESLAKAEKEKENLKRILRQLRYISVVNSYLRYLGFWVPVSVAILAYGALVFSAMKLAS